MKLNLNCIRIILLDIEKNQILNSNNSVKPYMIYELIESIQEYQFSESDIVYSIKQMGQSNILDIECRDTKKGFYCEIIDITPKGHEFIANISLDTNWEKTKRIAKKTGSFALNNIFSIASSVISDNLSSLLN